MGISLSAFIEYCILPRSNPTYTANTWALGTVWWLAGSCDRYPITLADPGFSTEIMRKSFNFLVDKGTAYSMLSDHDRYTYSSWISFHNGGLFVLGWCFLPWMGGKANIYICWPLAFLLFNTVYSVFDNFIFKLFIKLLIISWYSWISDLQTFPPMFSSDFSLYSFFFISDWTSLEFNNILTYQISYFCLY